MVVNSTLSYSASVQLCNVYFQKKIKEAVDVNTARALPLTPPHAFT